MTLVALPSPLVWPGLSNGGWLGTAGSTAGSTLDAAGEYEGCVFCAQQDMTISHVAWRPNSVSGSPTADVRIETVSATGFPSGTLFGTNTNIVTGVLTAAARTDALTASATITKGQFFAVIFQYNGGTNFTVRRISSTNSWSQALPYRVVNTGAPAKGSVGLPVLALGSSSTTFYPVPRSFPAVEATATFNNTSTAARANRFQVPFACRAVGLVRCGGASLGDFNIMIQDDSNNELSSSSTAIDGDFGTAGAALPQFLYFDNPVTLSIGTNYRMVIEPSSATNVDECTIDMPSADFRSCMPGGVNFYRSTRSGSTWSDDTDSVLLLDLLIDQLSDNTGGGGSTGISRARGAAGGM